MKVLGSRVPTFVGSDLDVHLSAGFQVTFIGGLESDITCGIYNYVIDMQLAR